AGAWLDQLEAALTSWLELRVLEVLRRYLQHRLLRLPGGRPGLGSGDRHIGPNPMQPQILMGDIEVFFHLHVVAWQKARKEGVGEGLDETRGEIRPVGRNLEKRIHSGKWTRHAGTCLGRLLLRASPPSAV